MPRRCSIALAVIATAGLVISALSATSASAQAKPVSHAAAVAVSQTARLHASTSRFPTSVTHTSGGAVDLREDGTIQRFPNVSNSPRPNVVRSAGGNSRLRAQNAVSWLPVVASTPVNTNLPHAGPSWQGLNEYSNQKFAGFSLEPPDQGLCAGNGHVLELINDVVRTYTKAGAVEHTAYLNDFFHEAGYQFTTDPSCVYDAGSNRFLASELTLDTDPNTGELTGNDWLNLAVSKTGNPNAGYNIYRIYATDDGSNGTPSHSGCPCIGDFPHLATDAHGVFLTDNEYPFGDDPGVYGNNFNGAQVYALSKSAVASGRGTVRVVHFENTRIPSSSGPIHPGFTLWPAQSAGTGYATRNNGTIYFVSSMAAAEARPTDFSGHANQIGFWWIGNTASLNNAAPSLTLQVKVLTVGSYGIPPLANQKAGPVPLKDCLNVGCNPDYGDPYTPEQEGGFDSSDSRPLTAYFTSGHVFSALDTAMSVSNNVQSGFEWFSINAAAGSSSVAHRGYVGVAHNNVVYPSIATDRAGNGYLGVTLSGDNYYPSAAYATWSGSSGMTGALHVAGVGKAPEDGFCEYLAFNCAGTPTPQIRPRWGDYGYAAWDGTQFYVANEYIARSCNFTTFESDYTCGNTRTFFGNFSTHIQVLH